MFTVHDRQWTGWSESEPPQPDICSRVSVGRRDTRVLLICDVLSEAATFMRALRALPLASSWVTGGLKGLMAAQPSRFDVLLVDQELIDGSGLEFLRRMNAADGSLRYLLLTDRHTTTNTAAAQAARAFGIVTKPLRAGDVIAAVNAALNSDNPVAVDRAARGASVRQLAASRRSRITPRSIAERWAALVLDTIDADTDPKTLLNWAQAVGMSRSALCECCRLVHIPAHDARDFTRLVRAICHSGDAWRPETVLNLADTRTLKKLLIRAGFSERTSRTPPLWEFLAQQTWIPGDNPALMSLQTLLYGPSVPSSTFLSSLVPNDGGAGHRR